MIKWAPSRAGLSLFFLALALLVLVFDRQTYKHYSGAEIVVPSKKAAPAAGSTVQTTIKDLTSKLKKPRVEAARYSVAADKNLFSASRKAWQAPAPAPAPVENKKNEPPKPPAPAPVRRDVVLYGTYISGKTRKAMLHFKRFRKGRLLVAEGAEAKDEDNGVSSRRKMPVYTLVKVEAKKVTLKDERGSEFTVNLYDNKKRHPAKTVNKTKIRVEKAAVPGSSSRGSSSSSASNVTSPATSTATSAAKKALISAKQIRKLSVEEKDALVKRGELIKHNTPFGPVYKRVRK